MQEKLQDYQKLVYGVLRRLNDVRFLGQIVFVVIVLLISWSGVKAIQANYNLQKQIAALQQQNEVQKLANENLKLQNKYYNTDQYLELSARQNFSLAAPNEKEILVPKSVAFANTVDLGAPKSAAPTADTRPSYARNYQAWIDFFLHRPGTTN
jgi:cell division protein FtsB